ncbi:MAG: LLM class flavin-dependent oxidoreductase [Immundisolibacteraceae bacterium]|nr:LLM class flavin-dependent oxidoreductase [Immundisolibacteraceae bacterium]
MSSDLKFGVYTEMNCMPGMTSQEAIWDVMKLIEQSDQLGYDVYMTIEHHFYETFGMSSNPLAVFSAAAQRTENIRFRTLCHTLPLHNPLILAGEIATAEVLTNGRLDLGFGRGHSWLYPAAGLPYEVSQPRYAEAVELVMKALTEENFSHKGYEYDVENVNVWPKLMQKDIPVYLTGTSGKSFGTAAKKGWGISVGGPAPYPMFAPAIAEYREACAAAGTTPVVSYIQPVLIGEDENKVTELAKTACEYFYRNISKPITFLDQEGHQDRLIASGYGFYASNAMNQMMELTYEQIIEGGMVWVGTPDQIRRRTEDFLSSEELDEFAIQVLPRGEGGGLNFAQMQETQELFATKVMPGLK